MIKESKLNTVKVNPLIIHQQDTSKIKGSDLFPSLYYNLFISSKKRSGKTSLINTIFNKCTDKKTIFFLFVPTIYVDDTWKMIKQKLEERGNIVNCYTDIMDGKINILNEIVEQLSIDDEPKEPEKKPKSLIRCESPKKKTEYKPKKISPEVVFCFDDASNILRNPAIATLLKKNRHLHANIIISSQYIHDLTPESIKQLDYFICFKSFSQDKMELIHKGLDLSIEFPRLWAIYEYCVEKPYSFLYINVRNEEFRCNFNKKIDFEI
jgi:hypothetical protein